MRDQKEPWWIEGDRKRLEVMRNAIEKQPETAMVRYQGDMRPLPVHEVRAKMNALAKRIDNDIARFQAVGGDYDKM